MFSRWLDRQFHINFVLKIFHIGNTFYRISKLQKNNAQFHTFNFYRKYFCEFFSILAESFNLSNNHIIDCEFFLPVFMT